MKTEAQLKAMQNDPKFQGYARAIAGQVIYDETERISIPSDNALAFSIKLNAVCSYRLALMVALAAQEVEDMRIEIEQLKDENAALRKQLIPRGL